MRVILQMPFISMSDKTQFNTKIMIFAEGTILKPKSFLTIYNHKSYKPIGNAAALIANWAAQGAEIIYCTSRKGKQAVEIAELLCKHGFQGTRLYYRDNCQKYKDLVEAVNPNILIEDDCRSIGGNWQMCITYVEPQIKNAIKSIIVKEFSGIDHLPCTIQELSLK